MARIRIRDKTNNLRTVGFIRIRDATGVLRNITRVRIRDASNILQTVFGGYSASATTPVDGSGSVNPITSPASTVTVTGGNAPFTYAWQAVSNPDGIAIVSSTSNSTTFRRSIITVGEVIYGTFVCRVTDALGLVVSTNNVDVSLTRT